MMSDDQFSGVQDNHQIEREVCDVPAAQNYQEKSRKQR
jgi:hypothetical protein